MRKYKKLINKDALSPLNIGTLTSKIPIESIIPIYGEDIYLYSYLKAPGVYRLCYPSTSIRVYVGTNDSITVSQNSLIFVYLYISSIGFTIFDTLVDDINSGMLYTGRTVASGVYWNATYTKTKLSSIPFNKMLYSDYTYLYPEGAVLNPTTYSTSTSTTLNKVNYLTPATTITGTFTTSSSTAYGAPYIPTVNVHFILQIKNAFRSISASYPVIRQDILILEDDKKFHRYINYVSSSNITYGQWIEDKDLPATTSADAGKFLTVNNNGDIVATAIETWQGGNF